MTPSSRSGLLDSPRPLRPAFHALMLLLWIACLGLFFAQVEIQVEGAAGWAAALPTWRIESSPWLDLFWGGRPMTGYHLWVFSFMALAFHLPLFIFGSFTIRTELRILGSLMIFWIVEDFLWFILNPAYGFARFNPQEVSWHKHWLFGMPADYVLFLGAGLGLMALSFGRAALRAAPAGDSNSKEA